MTGGELALLTAAAEALRETAGKCRMKETPLHMARAEGLDAAADVLEDLLSRIGETEITLLGRIAAQLEALEAVILWGSKMGRAVVPFTDPLRLVATPGPVTAMGETYGAAALDLALKLQLSPGRVP